MKFYNVIKTTLFLNLIFLSVSLFLCIPQTYAEYEPHTQWGLPEGAKARLGKGGINDITCSEDGALLAVASQIGIWIYDFQTGEELALITGHTERINSISFSPDGRTLASGSHDNTVRLWDMDTRTEIGTLEGHTAAVNSVVFSPDGRTLASGSDDGTVLLWDIASEDISAVLDALDTAAAAPAVVSTTESLQRWIDQAKQRNRTDARFQNLLTTLRGTETVPKATALLANYPNPFNPETWIPYQLAKEADVTLRIYAIDGTLVRTLALGHQPAGIYQRRSRAVYWDGRNAVGEPVASGVYFYTFTAGEFTATRKMLILK